MSRKPTLRAAPCKAFLLISSMIVIGGISGCSTLPVDSACKSFAPITWSKQDTLPTQRQVVAHNRAYDAICPATKLTAANYP